MVNISKAAQLDFDEYGGISYALDVPAGTAPRFIPKYLSHWPPPLCSGWSYDWENIIEFGVNTVKITLRKADAAPLYYYCLTRACSSGGGSPINDISSKKITCDE